MFRLCSENLFQPVLSSPLDGAAGVALRPQLSWDDVSASIGYSCTGDVKRELRLELSEDNTFNTDVVKIQINVNMTSFTFKNSLKLGTTYGNNERVGAFLPFYFWLE